ICYTILGRQNPKFLEFCQDHPGVVASVLSGASLATSTCKNQLRYDMWGCYGVNDKITHVIVFSNRETAYLYALASAAIAHTLYRDCSKGKIKECLCDSHQSLRKTGEECLSNADWSLKMTRTFTDLFEFKSKSPNARTLMNLHNSQIGRKITAKHIKKMCKCHGTSTACTYNTCWNILVSFEDIGQDLLNLYRNAAYITKSNKDHTQLKSKLRSKSLSKKLVYLQTSVNYCLSNHKKSGPGTRGRECKMSVPTSDPGHCNNLCCGRGLITNLTITNNNCKCTYTWCCQMVCEKCLITRYKYYCK
ncbi:uncharacterized protein TRIADDRAFT_30370, partial [Trichoplax adhaerens]